MFMPRALKVKRPAEGSDVVLTLKKKSKTGEEEETSNDSSETHVQDDVCEENKTQNDTVKEAGQETSFQDTDEEDEPVKSFKKSQRWPEPGEPVCVMCGRYGEYICDSTDNDVCSLECKANHLAKMGMGTGTEVFNRESINRGQTTSQHHPPVTDFGVVGGPEAEYSYKEDLFISGLTEEQVNRIQQELGISTKGRDAMRPIVEFEHCHFPTTLGANLKKAGYETPTPIQMQMVPVGLSGRDVIASADTGSGKTVAFLLPVVVKALKV